LAWGPQTQHPAGKPKKKSRGSPSDFQKMNRKIMNLAVLIFLRYLFWNKKTTGGHPVGFQPCWSWALYPVGHWKCWHVLWQHSSSLLPVNSLCGCRGIHPYDTKVWPFSIPSEWIPHFWWSKQCWWKNTNGIHRKHWKPIENDNNDGK